MFPISSSEKVLSTPVASSRLAGLDGFRGIAILVVVLNHFLQNLVPGSPLESALLAPFQSGWGIAAFLTLSGFLIGAALFKYERFSGRDARLFLMRRALRILPLYYALLVVTLLLVPRLSPHAAASEAYLLSNQSSLWALWANIAITFRQQWLFYGDSINLVHLWTVSLQEQFVLLSVLICCFIPRKSLPALLSFMIAAAPVVRLIMLARGYQPLSLYTFTFARTDSFFAGQLLAYAWRRGMPLIKLARPAVAILVGGSLLWIAAAALDLHHWNGTVMATAGYTLQAAMLTAVLLLLLIYPRAHLTRRLDNPVLGRIGRYSFGMFCLHMLVFPMIEQVMQPLAPAAPSLLFAFGWLVAAVSIAGTFAAAVVCHHAFERPILELRNALQPKRASKGTPTVVPAAIAAAVFTPSPA